MQLPMPIPILIQGSLSLANTNACLKILADTNTNTDTDCKTQFLLILPKWCIYYADTNIDTGYFEACQFRYMSKDININTGLNGHTKTACWYRYHWGLNAWQDEKRPKSGLGSMQGKNIVHIVLTHKILWVSICLVSIRKFECGTVQPIPPKVVLHQSSSSTQVVYHWRSSSTEGCLPPKVVSHQSPYSTEGFLPPKVIFHWRLSTTKDRLPLKIVFHWRLFSTKGCLPPNVVLHRRSSSTEFSFTFAFIHFLTRQQKEGNLSILPTFSMIFWRKCTKSNIYSWIMDWVKKVGAGKNWRKISMCSHSGGIF